VRRRWTTVLDVVDARWVPLRVAWDEALYGANGFYRTSRPADHFRTSAHVSPAFGRAVVELARREGITSICDLGAGGGELLAQIHLVEPTWRLLGVEVRPRPAGLPAEIGWQQELPVGHDGLVFANELLDNVPCDVVELDRDGRPRVLEVDRCTGDERLGPPADQEQLRWLSSWWPMTTEGDRAEIGLTRDALWVRTCASNPAALCVAVDYGHSRTDRPAGGSLASYREGVQRPVSYDGRDDITASVAFDSLAAAVGGTVRRQRDVLHELGISGQRPPIDRAPEDPAAYLRALAAATEAAELTEVGGLGNLFWLRSPITAYS
jgi:SAM-dependent MidA family methyltransferase